MNKKFIIVLFFTVLCSNGALIAQKTTVEITSVEDVDNKLIVKYNFIDSKESQRFNVTLEITSSTGQYIQANSLSGDLGNRISGGQNKQIVWDYMADGFVMSGNLNFEVIALLTSAEFNMARSLFLSTVCPGLGLNSVDKSHPYWLMGVAAYACLGTSFYLNKKANDNYSSYLSNTEDNLNDELLNKSRNQNKLSKTFGYSALGIWGINLVWTVVRTHQKNKTSIGSINNRNLKFYSVYDPILKTNGFGLNYRF